MPPNDPVKPRNWLARLSNLFNEHTKAYATGILPAFLGAFRTWMYVPLRGHRIIDDIRQQNWNDITRPPAYLTATFLIYTLIVQIFGPIYTRPGWAKVIRALPPVQINEFSKQLDLETVPNLKVNFETELMRSGLTPLSQRIQVKVKSIDPDAISLYLATKNEHLARAFSDQWKKISKYDKYHDNLMILMGLPIGILFAAVPIHLVLRSADQPYRHATQLLIYFQGFWQVIAMIPVALDYHYIAVEPADWTVPSVLVVVSGLIITIATALHAHWLFRLLYGRSGWRTAASFVLAYPLALIGLGSASVAIGYILPKCIALLP